MWEVSLRVAQEGVVQVTPERAWSLVRESAAWTARPGRFAFDLPAQPAAGRFRCVLGPFAASPGLGGSVLEICDEVPGQAISLRHRGVPPMGGGLITLSVLPQDRGAAIRLSTEGTVLRERKAECKAVRRKDLAAWARVLQDVLEGRRPWPDTAIPASLAQESATRPMLIDPQVRHQPRSRRPADRVGRRAPRTDPSPQYRHAGLAAAVPRTASVRPACGRRDSPAADLALAGCPGHERGEQARSQATEALQGRAAACQAAIERA
jgi:hypothetical protein